MASIEAQVAAAANPKDAMLVIARALDALLAQPAPAAPDPWDLGWDLRSPPERSAAWLSMAQELAEGKTTIIQGDDTTDIVIPLPSAEKLEARRQFERQSLRLSENLGTEEDWNAAYAKGGPLWIYHANRDLVMTYPDAVRQAMVADLLEDDPRAAHEMGRDVLKEPCNEYDPNSPAMRIDEGVAPVKGGSE